MSDIQAGLSFARVGKNKLARIGLKIGTHKFSQAASRDHEPPPMFGKTKPVGTLNLVWRQKGLKALSINFAFKAGMPHMDFAVKKIESRIQTSIHEAN